MHVARLKHPGPATEETWVTDACRGPAAGRDRRAVGLPRRPDQATCCRTCAASAAPAAKPVLCFDRGGWSPDLFATRHRRRVRPAHLPQSPSRQGDPRHRRTSKFTAGACSPATTAAHRSYDLADTGIEHARSPAASTRDEVLDLRQVTRRDKGNQVHILTTREAGPTLPAAGGRLPDDRNRWREENYFRYARAALRARRPRQLRRHPRRQPAGWSRTRRRKPPPRQVSRREEAPRRRRGRPRSASWPRCAAPPPAPPPIITNRDLAKLDKPVDAARRKLTEPPRPRRRPSPRRSRSASTTRTWCGSTPRPSSSPTPSGWPPTTARSPSPAPCTAVRRAGDEAYAIIREALTASGDIIPGDRHPHHPARPAVRAPPHPRHRRPLRQAQRRRRPLPRHQPHPPLRDQAKRCINDLLCQES